MKAVNIYKISGSPAPKDWEKLPDIVEQKPKFPCELSLSLLEGTNIVIWHYRTLKSVYWIPYGNPILVKEAE